MTTRTMLIETTTTILVERSFADLITAIEGATELPAQRRRHWVCSAAQIAKGMGRPAAAIPARWHAVRFAVGQLHHARLGVTAKTLSNHRANLKAALRWFGNEQGVPQKGTRLSPDWAWFRDRLDDRLRARLYSLMRYCSARGIGPAQVNDTIFDQFWNYRAETTGRATHNTARRFMVRACGWFAPAAHRTAPQDCRACVGQISRRPAQRPRQLFRRPCQAAPEPQRQADSTVQADNDPDPPRRACRDGAHGGQAR